MPLQARPPLEAGRHHIGQETMIFSCFVPGAMTTCDSGKIKRSYNK